MSIEMLAAAAAAAIPPPTVTPGTASGNAGNTGAMGVPAQYGFSLAEVARFEGAMARAQAAPSVGDALATEMTPTPASPALLSMLAPFEHVNAEAARLSEVADAAATDGHDLSPGEMIMLTVRCHEFLFHCQLTSNIANRTSDGIQQLFRQQS